MKRPLTFICNARTITTRLPSGTVVLDFLREHEHLTGTKAACREGDCGSCTVLVGSPASDKKIIDYRAVTSCLLPIGDMQGKHLVSIEGLNPDMESTMSDIPLTPVQQIFVEEGATQCGFCTPGFVMSLTCFLLRDKPLAMERGIEAVAGNICRCTGYGSIKRSISRLVDEYGPKLNGVENRLNVLIQEGIVPDYFRDIPDQLISLSAAGAEAKREDLPDVRGSKNGHSVLVAGGTDLYVQQPEKLSDTDVALLSSSPDIRGVSIQENRCRIGAGTPIEDLREHERLSKVIPSFPDYLNRIASTQIRERATVGGNLVNASPIGDLSVFFLAIDTKAGIRSPNSRSGGKDNGDAGLRIIPLSQFFLAYKKLDLHKSERLEYLEFPVPDEHTFINFEKVSRRTYLDIASVNSAIQMTVGDYAGNVKPSANPPTILELGISAGGVAPVPLYCAKTVDYMRGEELTPQTVRSAAEILNGEINPISDIRGSAAYKRLLLRQLFFAHFITLFPNIFSEGELL